MIQYTKHTLKEMLEESANKSFGVTASELTEQQMYKCVATVVRDILLGKRSVYNKQFKAENRKRIHYLSMEFLMGRSLKNNLFNLGLDGVFAEVLKKYKVNLSDLYEYEPDAGLGNGGLGRLAACYLDGMASCDYPAMGHSLRYEYGLFQQKIVNGWQTELPDNWLPGGEVWLKERPDKATYVRFGGEVKEIWTDQGAVWQHVDYQEVEAFPYDMVVPGYRNDAVSVLRLWAARNKRQFDFRAFGQGEYLRAMEEQAKAELITKVLYPSDNHEEGKELRLKQEYFLVSAAMQNITNDHYKKYGHFDNFAEMVAVHINDTHPALCVPELMRIFMDNYNLSWDYSWNIVKSICAYTNHTVLAEALECWPEHIFRRVLPRIYQIVVEINERTCRDFWDKCHDWQKVSNLATVAYGQVRMANLSIVGSHCVNGVSDLHSRIIRKSLFSDFYSLNPEKFTNVTNGIAYRRWLCQSNPRLSKLLTDCIGDGFTRDADELKKFNNFADDTTVLKQLAEIKLQNKVDFANIAMKKLGTKIDPNTRFDVQVKRLHEYKRQLLNVLKIISLYHDLKENPDLDVTPQTFIFGAKAAPSYYTAKEVIKLICFISKDLESNPKIREKLNVVFMENYCVTMAESLMPAAEISQQISLAGKEASGTGNMKFMINGALTLGTLDGANVEISEAVGADNIFIFGLQDKQVQDLWGKGYNSIDYYFKNPKLRVIVEDLNKGFGGESFENISNYLLRSNQVADPYMCFADFASYMDITEKMDAAYKDPIKWNQMSLKNIAEAGRFSADRAVREYATKIWRM
ncbi:MAG TPA: glycogen/starch/alpha-glucan phosphorylase [Candidatus Limihabitans stercoravium]|nr:glycogen/starch/alpha-glucan phosphorylase [Candidatus Limihabitans stercoravium]